MARSVAAVTAVMLTLSTGTVIANAEKFDKSVADAAARIAAAKLGELRNTIGFDKKPDMVSHKDKEKEKTTTPAPEDHTIIWIPPEADEPERITDAGALPTDQTLTGSVEDKRKQTYHGTYWEWFDADGSPIKRP